MLGVLGGEGDLGIEALEGVEVVFGCFVEGPGVSRVGFGELRVEEVFAGVDWVSKQLPRASQTSRRGPFW